MLCLEAKSVTPFVNLARFSGNAAVEKVSGVKLYARLGGVHLHLTSGRRLVRGGRQREVLAWFIQDKVVVVAIAELKLRLVLYEARAGLRQPGELRGRGLHAAKLSRRN